MLRYFKVILSGAIAFAAASIVFGQEPPKLITLESRGAAAKTLFEEISKQAGQTLTIGQSLAQEPLVLRLDKAQLETVMAKLAFAMDAEWINEPSGKRLVAIKKPSTEKGLIVIARIQKQQQKALERLQENPEFSLADARALADQLEEHFRKQAAKTSNREYERDEAGSKLARKGPYAGLGYRIFTQLDPKEMALVTKSRRIVWSTRPTAMQRALPNSVWNTVNQFQKENGYWREAVGSRQFQIDMNRGIDSEIYQLIRKNSNWAGDPYEADDAPAVPVKVLVIGSSWGEGLTQLEVKLVDAKGKYIARYSVDTYSLTDDSRTSFEAPKKDPNSVKIELDAMGKEFVSQQDRFNGGKLEKPPLSPELESFLLNPEKNEPLALIAGQAMVKYAIARKVQLVAVLLDRSMYVFGTDEKGVVDGEMMMTMHRRKGWGYRTEEKDGWIVTGPALGEVDERIARGMTRFDRKAVGKLVRNAKKVSYLTFEDAADYLTATVKEVNDEVDYSISYVLGFFVTDASLIQNEDSRKLMLIYGSMDPMQRRSILEGRTMPFRSLLPNQQELIRSCIFGRDMWRIRFEPTARPNQDPNEWQNYYNGIASEPTERYANGVNPQSPVTCKLLQSAILRCTGGQNGQTYNMETTADQFGAELFYRSLPEGQRYSGSPFEGGYTGFVSVGRRTMNLKVVLDDSTNLTMEAHEVISQSPKVDSYEKLPAEVVKTIEAARKAAAEGHRVTSKPPPTARR